MSAAWLGPTVHARKLQKSCPATRLGKLHMASPATCFKSCPTLLGDPRPVSNATIAGRFRPFVGRLARGWSTCGQTSAKLGKSWPEWVRIRQFQGHCRLTEQLSENFRAASELAGHDFRARDGHRFGNVWQLLLSGTSGINRARARSDRSPHLRGRPGSLEVQKGGTQQRREGHPTDMSSRWPSRCRSNVCEVDQTPARFANMVKDTGPPTYRAPWQRTDQERRSLDRVQRGAC